MEGVPPSCNEDDVNLTSNQFDFQSPEDSFNISELLLSPPEVPGNQSFMLCNDHGGQNMVVDNNVINDSIQQTTDQFPPSFPQTMMEGFLPSSMEDNVNFTSNQFDLQSLLSELELLSPPPEFPVNQSSISCNDQGGQNNVINDSIQQTTQFPTSFPETMTTMGNVINDSIQRITPFPTSLPETMTTMGVLDGTSSSWINQNEPNRPKTPSRHQNSFIHQPQPGHGYMTPDTTTSQHAGFNQPGQSFSAPRIQFLSNQGQAVVIPDIDNMQQDNFVPRNSGNSTRSRMDNLQVRGLQINQTARPNASNPGLDTSVQSQIRGLNTQQVEMVGLNDPFWNYVEYRADGSMKCKFCPHPFANKTSISRIKWHLSGERGHDVAICRGVTKEVQEAAFLAMCGRNKRHKNTASSINVNDCGISTMVGGIGRVQREVQVVEPGGGEERISSHAVAGNDVVSVTGMRAPEDGVSEGALESRPRTEPVDRSLEQSNAVLGNLAGGAGRILVGVQGVLEQGAGEERINRVRGRTEPVEEDVENSRRSVQVGAGARSSESLKYNKTRGVPLPTSSTKPVGQAFEENMKVIWSLLMDGDVSTIGIYGMGGVGKSIILQHIYNKLLQKPDICDHVWWVTMSQDFSIYRLQNLIAKRLHLDLSSEDDDLHRAAKLSAELMKKQKWILILDDLWNNFELYKAGIPEKLKGCKLMLTTRLETVCHGIACDHKIQVKPLSEGEAWTLFKENLGRDIALSSEVEGIAKDIARECDGLPLGIITVAGSLRGVDDLHQWRNTLKKLRESKFKDKQVFELLRFSYDRLGDVALQQCLLYCALFPEDYWIRRKVLIGHLIDEGIIKGTMSRKDAFDEGHTMLNSQDGEF